MINVDIIESIRIVEIFVELHAERIINFARMNVRGGVCVLQAMQNQAILEFVYRAMRHCVHLIDSGNDSNFEHLQLYKSYFLVCK